MKRLLWAGLAGLLLPLSASAGGGQNQSATVPTGGTTTINVNVAPATAPAPPVSFVLGSRHGHVTPTRSGCNHTGAGYIDVAQPTPDVLVITMTGVAVATGHPTKDSVAAQHFDLQQCFEVSFDDPKVKKAKFTMEGRVIGLLRSEGCSKKCNGAAEVCEANAVITAQGGGQVIQLAQVPHSVACGENLSINDHEGPVENPAVAGKFTLCATFGIQASHCRSVLPCKAASAEFAPDPALDPLWISYWEPFHGVAKKDFGYQVTIKLVPDTSNGDAPKEEPKK